MNHIPALVIGGEVCGRCIEQQAHLFGGSITKAILKNRIAAYDKKPPTIDGICAALLRIKRDLMNEAVQRMETGEFKTAALAIHGVCAEMKMLVSKIGSVEAQRQIDEICDIEDELCRSEQGKEIQNIERGCVLSCDRLSTEAALFAMRNMCVGVITRQIASRSHACLLLRGARITIARLNDDESTVLTGRYATLCPNTQSIYVSSKPRQTDAKRKKMDGTKAQSRLPRIQIGGKSVFMLCCNTAGSFEHIPHGAPIGLYRTELFCVEDNCRDLEDALTAEFSAVLAGTVETTLRLPDFGGDKPLPDALRIYESDLNEENRGVRFLLAHPELMNIYIRSALRASRGNRMRLLVPMLRTAEELNWIRAQVLRCADTLGMCIDAFSNIPLGAMIETKEAIENVAEIVHAADFASIGTNDLFAALSNTDRFSTDSIFLPDESMVQCVLRAAAEPFIAEKKRVCACGELACNFDGLQMLLRAGIREASVPVSEYARIASFLMKEAQ